MSLYRKSSLRVSVVKNPPASGGDMGSGRAHKPWSNRAGASQLQYNHKGSFKGKRETEKSEMGKEM